jgi:hypothetical protein
MNIDQILAENASIIRNARRALRTSIDELIYHPHQFPYRADHLVDLSTTEISEAEINWVDSVILDNVNYVLNRTECRYHCVACWDPCPVGSDWCDNCHPIHGHSYYYDYQPEKVDLSAPYKAQPNGHISASEYFQFAPIDIYNDQTAPNLFKFKG